jgi:hypothetical protein
MNIVEYPADGLFLPNGSICHVQPSAAKEFNCSSTAQALPEATPTVALKL